MSQTKQHREKHMFLRCKDALRLWRSLQVLEGQIVRINSFTPSQLSGCGIGSIWWLSPTRPLIFGSCDQEKPTGVLKVDIFQEVSCIDGTLLDVFLFLDTRYRSCATLIHFAAKQPLSPFVSSTPQDSWGSQPWNFDWRGCIATTRIATVWRPA
jgi:hypothetical protein